jgi:predicted flap endonuclease-1-like 5' DNA nuclease
MVSIESQVTSEKEWDLSFLMEMLNEAQELNDHVQAKQIAKRALEQAKKQGNEEWEAKFQAILDEYSTKIRFEGETSEETETLEANIASDLSEVKGIGTSIALKLRSNGFTTIESLASSTPEQLARVPGVGISSAQKLIENAQAYVNNNGISPPSPSEGSPQESSIGAPTLSPYQKLKERTVVKSSPKPVLKAKKEGNEPKLTDWTRKPSNTSPIITKESKEQEEVSYSYQEKDTPQEIVQGEVKNQEERWVPKIEVDITDLREEYPEEKVSPTMQEEMEEVLSNEKSNQEEFNEDIVSLPQKSFIEEVDIPPLKTSIFPSKRSIVEMEEEPEYSQEQASLKYVSKDSIPKDAVKRSRIPYREQRFKTLPNAEQLLQRQQSAQKILEIVREVGMFEIPMNAPELREVFRAVDLLACKPMRGDNGRCIILLVPIKHVLTTDPVFVWDSHVMTGQINSDPTTPQNMAINTHTKKLLQASEYLFNDMINGRVLISLVARHIGISMKTNVTVKNKRLYLGSGEIEYQVIIDPTLLCDTQVYCMEKTLPYAYQQGSNLHVVSYDQLDEFLEYLEVKYRLLIRHDTSQNAIMRVNEAKLSTFKQLQLFSLPFLAYGMLFSFFLILGLQEVVRFCIMLGFGLCFVYGGVIGYLLYRHFHSLKSVNSEFSVPYHQKPLNLSEEDFILIRDQLSAEWMTQFSHEVENHQGPLRQKPKINTFRVKALPVSSLTIKEKGPSQPYPNRQHLSKNSPIQDKYQNFLDD